MLQVPPQESYPLTAAELRKALEGAKSFVAPAVFTMILYWSTLYVGGLVANLAFLSEASNVERITGTPPEGKGCLTALLWVNFLIPIIFLCGAVLIGTGILSLDIFEDFLF
jgi:hypothetical protein